MVGRIKLQILITDCNDELNYLCGSLNIVSVIKSTEGYAHIKFG